MIESLRRDEAVMLYANMLQVPVEEEQEIVDFLHREFLSESLEYPYVVPEFDGAAALWAAKTVNTAAQLILYRKDKPAELAPLLPAYMGEHTAGAILSADLCLRFIPDMLVQLMMIDREDELIPILEGIMAQWHYSAVKHKQDISGLNFDVVAGNQCLLQLYTDRIIAYKHIQLALHPAFKGSVQASLGIYGKEFWNNFNTEISINE